MQWCDRGIGDDSGLSPDSTFREVSRDLGKKPFGDEDAIRAVGEIYGNVLHARIMQESAKAEKNCFLFARVESSCR